jgi:hypothetical protein
MKPHRAIDASVDGIALAMKADTTATGPLRTIWAMKIALAVA